MSLLRPDIPETFHPLRTNIVAQIIDWKTCDLEDTSDNQFEDNEYEDDGGEDDDDGDGDDDGEGRVKKRVSKNKKKLVIRGYGVTEDGNSICIELYGFQPYFYFKIPQDWTSSHFEIFKKTVEGMVEEYNRKGLMAYEMVDKKEFYGFTNNQLFKYGVFVFKNQASYYSYLRVFKEKMIYLRRLNVELDMSKKLYETKVTSLLRFFHVQDLDPSGWCEIECGNYQLITGKNKKTRCQLEVKTVFQHIRKKDSSNIGKLIVASFDLECCSEDGTFPKYDRPNDKVIQIGTTVYLAGDNECKYQYICTLGESLPIEGAHVECYHSERDLILGWARFMANLDPDIITGYNIWGFDWEFLYKRAEYGFQTDGRPNVPYHTLLYRVLQRIRPKTNERNLDDRQDPNIKLTIQNLSSSALGDNFLKFIDIEGVVQMDLLKVVQRDHKLDSYKLDNVAKHFMKKQKVDLTPNELFRNFRIGTPDKIQEIAVYCIMDCKLVNELVNKLDVITANLGMSNVCCVPFSYLFLRGQGIKIFSLVAKFCREENFLIKDLSEEDIDQSSYEGAIVFVPKPGIYFDPVVVMDYNSLYPSSMIAENISHDSILGYKEYRLKPGHTGEDKENDFELIRDTIQYEYQDLPGYHYIDIDYDLLREDENAEAVMGEDGKKRKKKVVFGYKMCRYAEADNGDKSVLPRILRKLLKARKDTRKRMEYVSHYMKDGTIEMGIPTPLEDGRIELFHVEKGKYHIQASEVESTEETFNDFQISILDGLQLAYKVTCNSLYGQVGASTSPICYKELAACTTATGRKMVCTARDLTLQTFPGSKLVYGDSVTGDTPIMLRKNGIVCIKKINDICKEEEWTSYESFRPNENNLFHKQQGQTDYEIWTSHGWSQIKKMIRHQTSKKIYRVMTPTGCVDVTEDHSLLTPNLEEIKPKDVCIGTELRHGTPYGYISSFSNDEEVIEKIIFDIRDENVLIDVQRQFMMRRKICLYTILQRTEDMNYIEMCSSPKLFYSVEDSRKIIGIWELRNTNEGEYVYDIETTDSTFQAGIGEMIVKNTDSVFINFVDHIKINQPEKEFTEKELLEESIQMGIRAAKNINLAMKAPQNIEYEKTLWPFTIFSKKRYFGNLYEHDPNKYKPKYMGIVLKRRDNAPIVKTIYGGVLDIILNKRNIEASKEFFRQSVQDLLDGKVDISQLVISKTLKADYANPCQIAHKVLADRMTERDAGNAPQSNDRVPYCYVDTCNLKCKICNGKVNHEKCKCITCIGMFCPTHLVRHREQCIKTCRFCKQNETQTRVKKCNTCTAYYCGKCFDKHMKRKDKHGNEHMDKCKKPLTHKILQGDILEHPEFITSNRLKIDYMYYLEHQIQVPVFQIFALIQDRPETIIADIVRRSMNAKKGNHAITDWLIKMKKNSGETVTPVITNENVENIPQGGAGAGGSFEEVETESRKFDITKPTNIDGNEEDDLMAELFEPEKSSDIEDNDNNHLEEEEIDD
jgi:DNA polymerase elongation subunit (family B)